MDSEERRLRAYAAPKAAVLASVEDRPDDLFEVLDSEVNEDPLGLAYRLTNVATEAVKQIARLSGDDPSTVLDRLVEDSKSRSGGGYLIPQPGAQPE